MFVSSLGNDLLALCMLLLVAKINTLLLGFAKAVLFFLTAALNLYDCHSSDLPQLFLIIVLSLPPSSRVFIDDPITLSLNVAVVCK